MTTSRDYFSPRQSTVRKTVIPQQLLVQDQVLSGKTVNPRQLLAQRTSTVRQDLTIRGNYKLDADTLKTIP